MSLRARLLIAVGVVALLALVVADVATYSSLRSFLRMRVDQDLQAAHRPIEQAVLGTPGEGSGGPIGSEPTGSNAGCSPGGSGFLQAAQNTFVEVRSSTGAVICSQQLYERNGSESEPRLPAVISGFHQSPDPGEPSKYFDASSAVSGGPSFRVRASQVSNGDILILAVPLSDTLSTLRRLLMVELAVSGGALLLAGVVGWWLVRLGIRPLVDIEKTADAIAGGELSHRVPVASPKTEVGRLAGALNVMLGRIEGAFQARDETERQLRRSEARLRRFVADASHELRTPVAAVSAYAELFDRGAGQHPEDLSRVMSGIRNETVRMGHLVDDLLMLARIDEGRPLQREPVELVKLAAESVHAGTTVGPQWPVQLVASEPIEIKGDPTRLRQVVDNLLANVRSHTPPGTSAIVRVQRIGNEALLSVEDNGPGIPDADRDKLFERFYRADASRSRSSGGAGLGLSIVQAIASAHHGRVSMDPRPGGGSIFSVWLPLERSAPDTAGNGSVSSDDVDESQAHN